MHEINSAADDALAHTSGALSEDMRALAQQVVQNAGWTRVRPHSPALDHLAGLLKVIVDMGAMFDMNHADTYLGLIDALAAYEVSRLYTAERIDDRDAIVQQMVVGQVVFGRLVLSLRRIGHKYHSVLRFPDENPR